MFREYLRNSPFVRILAPFVLGLASSGYVVIFHTKQLAFFCLLVLAILLLWLHRNQAHRYGKRWIFGIVLNIFLLFSGNIYLCGIIQMRMACTEALQSGSFLIRTLEHQKSTLYYEKYTAEIKQSLQLGQTANIGGRIECWIKRDSSIKLPADGQYMILRSKVTWIPQPTNPEEFNYQRYLFNKDILGQSWVRKASELELIPLTGFAGLKPLAARLRDQLLSVFTRYGITGDENALLSALTFGVRDAISNDINKAFSQSGAMHVLSVSGLHVGIFYLVFSSMLGFLMRWKKGRWIRAILLIAFLWLYAFLTGLSPSVLRSAAMFSFVAAGQSLNREASIYNTLSASALILLLIDPFMFFDVGFQLSYLAVFSIVFFQPLIYKALNPKHYLPDKLWQLISLSLAAQLGTFPLSLYYFHQFPNYFILTNLMVVPLATIILYLALILLAFAFLPMLARVLAWLLMMALKGMLLSVSFIEALPGATFQNINNSLPETIVLYLIIASFIWLIVSARGRVLFTTLTFTILFLMMNFYQDYKNYRQQFLAVYNIPGTTAIQCTRGSNSSLFYGGIKKARSERLDYYLKGACIKKGIDNYGICYLDSTIRNAGANKTGNVIWMHSWNGLDFITQGRTTVVVVSEAKNIGCGKAPPLKVDFLILRNNPGVSLKELNQLFSIRKLIIDSSCNLNETNSWMEQAQKLQIPCYAVAQSGAFLADI